MTPRAKKRGKPGRDPWTMARGNTATDLDDLADRTGLTVFERARATEALDAATARAAWGTRPASPSTPTAKPGNATRREPPRNAPTIDRDTPPPNVWEALRRLLACNKQQLAARLGVSRHTLQRWERDELTDARAAQVAALMQEALAATGPGWTVARSSGRAP